MAIGAKIKQRREELRLDIKEVAKAAGMGPTTLYDLERGDQKTTTRLHALCKVLGLNPDWVAYGRGQRLVQSDQKSVESPVSNTGIHDMAHLARDVFEIALILSSLNEPMRSSIIAMIHTVAGQQASDGSAPVPGSSPAPSDPVRK
jgi:transcriptional regulator with XRE-family HTH domain